MATIFMPLLQEETDAWRPVEVTPLIGADYRVEGPMPDGETWQFAPGSLIQIKWKKFADGEQRLIPQGSAPTARSISRKYIERYVGILAGLLPQLLLARWLPRQPDAHPEALPVLLATAISVVIACLVLIRLRPKATMLKWAAWSMLGFSILMGVLSLTLGK